MPRPSRLHHGDEFGQPQSGTIAGSNAKSARGHGSWSTAADILVDGIVERESGVTPPPSPISLKALVIGLVVVFVIGVVVAILVLQFAPPVITGS
jgi:hypothetical protein